MGANANASLNSCDGGILVAKADDALAYSKAIQLLLNNQSRRQEMGKKNSLGALEFSVQSVKESMKKIYCRLLS
jgi:glycosyltransferase involved in cell wall biosynthesis